MNDERPGILSEQGVQRRDAMLGELMAEMVRLKRRRARQRSAVAVGFPSALIALMAYLWWPSSSQQPFTPPLPTVASNWIDEAIVKTDHSIVERLASRAISKAERINDDTLLDTLAELNQPAGLIRTEERIWLVSNTSRPLMWQNDLPAMQ